MKKADLSALEKALAHLPVDLKQHLANQLLGQINAQEWAQHSKYLQIKHEHQIQTQNGHTCGINNIAVKATKPLKGKPIRT